MDDKLKALADKFDAKFHAINCMLQVFAEEATPEVRERATKVYQIVMEETVSRHDPVAPASILQHLQRSPAVAEKLEEAAVLFPLREAVSTSSNLVGPQRVEVGPIWSNDEASSKVAAFIDSHPEWSGWIFTVPNGGANGAFVFVGNFIDNETRAIPYNYGSVSSVDEAMRIATDNNWAVFGLQYHGELWFGSDVERATSFGRWTDMESPDVLGEGWMNRVFVRRDVATAIHELPAPILPADGLATIDASSISITVAGDVMGGGTGREYASNLLDSGTEPWNKWLHADSGLSSSWIQYDFTDGPRCVREYTVTSANDCPERDPVRWTLYGRVDGDDIVLDTAAYAFSEYERWQVVTRIVSPQYHDTPVTSVRLDIEDIRERCDMVQLGHFSIKGVRRDISFTSVADSRWQLLGQEHHTVVVPPNCRVRYGADGKYVFKRLTGEFCANNDLFGDPIYGTLKYVWAAADDLPGPVFVYTGTPYRFSSAMAISSPPAAGSIVDASLIDLSVAGDVMGGGTGREYASNLLSDGTEDWNKWLHAGYGVRSSWIQYDFKDGGKIITEYGVCSGNDCPERDPARWTLFGLHQGDWVELHRVTSVPFSEYTRWEWKWFAIPPSFADMSFSAIKLEIHDVRSPCDIVQLGHFHIRALQ